MISRNLHAVRAGILLGALLLATPVWSMRCGNVLISRGDPKAKILEYCGEPVGKSSRYQLRPDTYTGGSGTRVNGSDIAGKDRLYVFGVNEVLVEEWTFNFGPDKLMRLVIIADGIVEEVRELGYGYR